ncbi:hypothetical protein PENVUL_c090G00407 [Penicillium vulpinum]|uniref:Ubiquitin 3 binding protein But2 C-terminal domain-containing protein n=1 Tax=Penicillium vulpinum TaxID=29845 RepID=A0A1V6R5M7_9EURO|nr:hypothetical protein PENVUL_c090G00407 [Penicillium vulpinum]
MHSLSMSQFFQLASIMLQFAASEETSTITFPWVGFGDNYFDKDEGRVIGLDGDKTTYAVSCPSAVTPCDRHPMTVVFQPNSFEYVVEMDYSTFTTSGCTFTGSPFPTTATCSLTQSVQADLRPVIGSTRYQVPGTKVERVIFTASMAIAGAYTPINTGTLTGTISSSASQASQTSSGPSDSMAKSTNVSTDAATTTISGNFAHQTPAPLVLVGGLLAGAMLL